MTNISALVTEGFSIMLVGMGVVFVLLSLLVVIVRAMTAFSRLFAAAASPVASAVSSDELLISVIGAAVHAYRRARASGALQQHN